MAWTHMIILIAGGIEVAWLGSMHSRNLITWEPIWVIFISWLSYASDLMEPESEWAKPRLVNGEYIDWQKVLGWMATCPVLILFLVSLTTFGGREASVRVVPLLVANQMMFLCGVTSGFCAGSARWWFYGGAVTFGCFVFLCSGLCFHSLYMHFGDSNVGASGRTFVLWLASCFFLGWVIFPIVWTFSHSGLDMMSDYDCSVLQMVGDLLSKNAFIVLAVVLKTRWLTDDPRPLSALLLWPTQPSTWGELASMLEANGAGKTTTEGAAAKHEPLARLEAARKLITNHKAVLNDLTRADAPPASQPHLKRLPGLEVDVDLALKEMARRLLGRRADQSRWRATPTTPRQAEAWVATANFLSARLQVSTEEVCQVPGHQQRQPDMGPAAGAAFRAVLAELAEEGGGQLQPSSWGEFASMLEANGAADTVADGAAAKHDPRARLEAARKLITNHKAVLNDLTRADGPPATQPHLKRLPGLEVDVDLALKEMARRLLGRRADQSRWHATPTTPRQAEAWVATANFLSARLQVSTEEVCQVPGHQQRKPDLSPAAGAAFRAVLAELAGEPRQAPAVQGPAGSEVGQTTPKRIRRRPSIGNVALDDMGISRSLLREEPAPTEAAVGNLGAAAATSEARDLAALLQQVAELVVAHANAPDGAAVWEGALAGVHQAVKAAQLDATSRKVKDHEAEVALAMQKLTRARSEQAGARPGLSHADVVGMRHVDMTPTLTSGSWTSSTASEKYYGV